MIRAYIAGWVDGARFFCGWVPGFGAALVRERPKFGDEDGLELSTLCRQLKLQSSDGKKYETDCANTEGMFRIIQL